MRSLWLPAALLGVGLLACSSDSTGSTTTTLDLTGTWHVSKYEFVKVANPATKTDVIAQGDAAVLVGTATAWTITVTLGTTTVDVEQGTYTSTSTSASFLNSKNGGETTTFAYTHSGNTVTMTGGSATFDFGTGDEPATVNLTIVKQ